MASAKMPEFSYSCEICGVEGLNDEEMRSHMLVYHLEGAVSCPFCDLGDISADEMLLHVNSAHLEYLTPERELLAFIDDDEDDEDEEEEEVDEEAEEMEGGRYGTPPDVPPNDLSHFRRENSNSRRSNEERRHLEHHHGLPSSFRNGAAMCPDPSPVKRGEMDNGDDDARVPNLVLPQEDKANGWNDDNNNNNTNGDDVSFMRGEKSDLPDPGVAGDRPGPLAGAGSSGSPLRSALALNLGGIASMSGSSRGLGMGVPGGAGPRPERLGNGVSVVRQCPLCPYRNEFPLRLEEHINRQHFDPTSPSFPATSPVRSHAEDTPAVYDCPLCVRTFQNSPDLELHVNIEHKDILSPAKPSQVTPNAENWSESCPVCCMSGFKDNQEMASHIEEHFNSQKAGVSPITPEMSCDRMLAREIERREKEVRRLREQREFEMLRAQYGMDNQGNFREQSLTNMQKAVYAGEMSVADYYERQFELRAAESNGVDDGSSCTKGLVPKIRGISASSNNVARTYMCTTVDHYASTYGDKGWGCGYRNMQMMVSSVLHHTGYNEQLYKPSLMGGGIYGMSGSGAGSRGWGASGTQGGLLSDAAVSRSAMPSISRLQQHVEWAWRQGFDLQGCDQLGGKLFNTRKWIGATEVVTFLSSLRIRCQLVDFHRPTSVDGSHPEMFSWVFQYFQKNDEFKPPLYLQHQGHSRTIVGVEQLKDSSISLLVFDPSHSPHQMSHFRNTATAISGMRLIRKSLSAMKARQYQVVAVCGIMDTEQEYQQSKVLRSIRVPQDR
ncbi:zinc finger-containing ubiquitin peptidase 1-like [Hetaerina americana]|uniref:zinc finger-containing ubiquitin peptidase 1-like n=1 Tax=Hetaerina americana TaxID=62018 RepID=UPI003A7F4526